MKRDQDLYEGLPTAAAGPEDSALLELPATTTGAAVLQARSRRAIRFAGEVFLPSWPTGAVGLPTVLLRSAFWAPGEQEDVLVQDLAIPTLGDDVRVLLTGKPLLQYDRRVFAACLAIVKDQPLSNHDAPGRSTTVTYYEMAHAMGNAYTLNTHTAIRSSLLRLRQAALQVRLRSELHQVPQLLDVAFTKGDAEPQGADELEIRIPEPVALLYGMRNWTVVPNEVLAMKALRGWLSGLLATQVVAETLSFERLHEVSGMLCRPNDFRRRVCDALEELQAPDVPFAYRVSSFEVTADKKWLTVRMARWG